MREWCSCQAAIRGSYKQVKEWRKEHRHEPQTPPEPEPQGSFSQVELSHQDDWNEPDMRIGFQRIGR